MLGLLDVDQRHSILPGGNISVRPRDNDVARVAHRHRRARNDARMRQIGHVEHFQSL